MDFLWKNFLIPMRDSLGYNPWTTLLNVLLFALAAFLYSREAKLRKGGALSQIRVLLPFVTLGSLVRSLADACFYPCSWPLKILFITPGIWLLVFSLFFVLVRFFGRDRASAIGWFLAAANVFPVLLRAKNPPFALLILAISAFGGALVLIVLKSLSVGLNGASSKVAFLAHALDAASTFVAVGFLGYREEHVLARLLISFGGPGLFFLAKILLIPALILALENSKEIGKGEKELGIAAIFVLGLGPGLRNTLSVLMGV